MKIALVQNTPERGDWMQNNPDKPDGQREFTHSFVAGKGWIDSNLADADNLIGGGCGADIYVLPEMFATGQFIDPSEVVQTMDGPIVEWLRDKASGLNAAVCGTLPIAENGHVYNRFCFAMPDGNLAYYDKHHLFTYSGEAEHYSRGDKRVVIEFRGLRIMLLICYDLRFPTFSRNRDDYDAVFYPANWPEKRILAWDTLLRARAIENQCFAIGVNRSGSDELGFYPGHSAIISPYGETLVQTGEKPQMVCADLDLEQLARFRAKFPVLQDAD